MIIIITIIITIIIIIIIIIILIKIMIKTFNFKINRCPNKKMKIMTNLFNNRIYLVNLKTEWA